VWAPLFNLLVEHWKLWLVVSGILAYNGLMAWITTLVFGSAAFWPAFISSVLSVFIPIQIWSFAKAIKKRWHEKVEKKEKTEEEYDFPHL
jgi:hypothetical protein